MNDLQAQLEEANKQKQELQEKVGTRVSLGRKRVWGRCTWGRTPELIGQEALPSVFSNHRARERMCRPRLGASSPS